MNILYVENHAAFAETVKQKFLSQHFVTVVPTLSAAREKIRANVFDVLLVDYDLDDGKVLSLCKKTNGNYWCFVPCRRKRSSSSGRSSRDLQQDGV